jgi:hypothetical protein
MAAALAEFCQITGAATRQLHWLGGNVCSAALAGCYYMTEAMAECYYMTAAMAECYYMTAAMAECYYMTAGMTALFCMTSVIAGCQHIYDSSMTG